MVWCACREPSDAPERDAPRRASPCKRSARLRATPPREPSLGARRPRFPVRAHRVRHLRQSRAPSRRARRARPRRAPRRRAPPQARVASRPSRERARPAVVPATHATASGACAGSARSQPPGALPSAWASSRHRRIRRSISSRKRVLLERGAPPPSSFIATAGKTVPLLPITSSMVRSFCRSRCSTMSTISASAGGASA